MLVSSGDAQNAAEVLQDLQIQYELAHTNVDNDVLTVKASLTEAV